MLNQKLQQSSNYACDMLISIFSKDESNFLCKGYMTILDRNLRFGLLAFFLYQMQKKHPIHNDKREQIYQAQIVSECLY